MRAASALLLVLPVTLASVPAQATVPQSVPLTCPVDDTEFEGVELAGASFTRGMDRDLCPHSDGPSPFFFQLSTCPSCGYTAPAARFASPVKPAVRQHVLDSKPPKGALAPHDQWARYAQIQEWDGADPLDIGESWIVAGWTVRLAWKARLSDASLAAVQTRLLEDARKSLNAAGAGGKAPFEDDLALADALRERIEHLPAAEQPLARFTVAAIYRARGENQAALQVIQDIPAEAAPPIREATAELRASVELEHAYLRKGLASMKKALKTEPPAAKAARATYIAAELARRVGNKRDAARFYEAAKKRKADRDPAVEQWIKRGLGEVQ